MTSMVNIYNNIGPLKNATLLSSDRLNQIPHSAFPPEWVKWLPKRKTKKVSGETLHRYKGRASAFICGAETVAATWMNAQHSSCSCWRSSWSRAVSYSVNGCTDKAMPWRYLVSDPRWAWGIITDTLIGRAEACGTKRTRVIHYVWPLQWFWSDHRPPVICSQTFSLPVPWRRLSCSQVGGRVLSPAALTAHFEKWDIDEIRWGGGGRCQTDTWPQKATD